MKSPKKISLEYIFSCTAGSLFRALTTETGLKSWFADNVIINGDTYEFFWGKSSQTARLINIKTNTSARFKWEELDNYFFEFKIHQYELTGDILLTITDFVTEEESEDHIRLWNMQIAKLKRAIGCPKN